MVILKCFYRVQEVGLLNAVLGQLAPSHLLTLITLAGCEYPDLVQISVSPFFQFSFITKLLESFLFNPYPPKQSLEANTI